MANGTKRIFISDIHMGDERSINDPNHYGWFKNNIPVLTQFLDDQLKAPNVNEVIILGDLFDTWVIPVNYAPLIAFDNICSNLANKPVIDKLKSLAANGELAYVPGNHDMAMDSAGISATKQFMETNFPGIRIFCNNAVPWGTYTMDTLAAEHGNHYCLFNAPDIWTVPQNSFLPLGYFISRIAAYKSLKTGQTEGPRDVFLNFLRDFMKNPDFIEDMFAAIVKDAGLNPSDNIDVTGIPGYTAAITVETVGMHFNNLIQKWRNTPGNINFPTAIIGDLENLSCATSLAYFDHYGSNTNIVIFGHTHVPVMEKRYDFDIPSPSGEPYHSPDDPCSSIYVNSGCWVDSGKYGCTYVETEEIPDQKKHYVRLKQYPGNACTDEGFVKM